jgi:hypothetical protein
LLASQASATSGDPRKNRLPVKRYKWQVGLAEMESCLIRPADQKRGADFFSLPQVPECGEVAPITTLAVSRRRPFAGCAHD